MIYPGGLVTLLFTDKEFCSHFYTQSFPSFPQEPFTLFEPTTTKSLA